MPISKKIKYLKEPLEIDLQLMVSELDTSAKDLRFLSRGMMTDAILIDAFDLLIEDIENGDGFEITTFDDNTVLYDYLDEVIIIHDMLGVKYVLLDCSIVSKIESKLHSYR